MTTPNDLPSVGTEEAWKLAGYLKQENDEEAATVIRSLVSERDELARRVRELEGALWGCIAAIERTHHCTEADRLASAEAARAALNASKEHP